MKRALIALVLSTAVVAPVAAADLSVAQTAQVKAVLEGDDNTTKMAAQIEAIVERASTAPVSRFSGGPELTVAQQAQIRTVNNSEDTTLQKARQIRAILNNG